MRVTICEDKKDLGREAAKTGAEEIRSTIARKGSANIAFVTGTSQIQTLKNLASEKDIDWSKVNVFFLDEYIGIPKNHKASSYNFLNDHFLSFLPNIGTIHRIDGNEDNVDSTLKSLNEKMREYPLDVAFVCIGENGHLALNDPPADLNTKDPYIAVELEKRSRKQQVNEGWFSNFEEVPQRAITMSVREIMSSEHIICSCPDQRKAKAVAMAVFDDITPAAPCAMLRNGRDVHLFLDRQSDCLILGDRRF